jgi:hypothetical protein
MCGEVDPAALPGGALEAAADRRLEAGVGVGDDQPHPTQPAGLQRPQESGPERLVLGVADVDAEHLAAAFGGDDDGLAALGSIRKGVVS